MTQTTTDITALTALLHKACGQVRESLPLTWRSPRELPADPLAATPDDTWQTWDPAHPETLAKNAPNWFYAEVVFPERWHGIDLHGAQAYLYINGYSPFTLWINGEETFTETHVWHATGPIAEPVITAIEPGQACRLVLCLEPTELPAGGPILALSLHPAPCLLQAVELGVADLQLRLAAKLAQTDVESAMVAAAAARVDQEALEAEDWPRLQPTLTALEEGLAFLSPRAKALTVHLVGHTHIDMDWMWTWKDTVHCARRDFKAITDMMDDYPDLTFTLSQVPLYKIVQEMDPDVFAKVQQRVAEGRWECAAGTWVEGDLNMADGESVARHILYAKAWTREHLGVEAKVLWEPDTFGHPGNMPQLAKLGDFDCYFHWRSNPGREHNWPARFWKGVDGTPVLAFSTCYGSSLYPDAIMGNLLNYVDFGLSNALHIWGLGDHGGGLPRHHLDLLARYRQRPLVPTIQFSTMARLREAILGEQDKLKSNVGETYSLFEGCFTTHAEIKRYNRACENALLAAEALCVLAGLQRNDTLREAWTLTLFNHFHDIADGAAVHDSYLDAYARAEECLAKAGQVTDEAADLLVTVDAQGGSLTLLNLLGFPRTEPVRANLPAGTTGLRDADGHVTPVQPLDDAGVFIAEGVPAFAGKTYTLVREALPLAEVRVREVGPTFEVETTHCVARVLKHSGAIGYYRDKLLDREIVNYGLPKHLSHVPNSRADLALNVFQLIDEAPNAMSAWLINDILKEENLLRGAEVTLVESGPVFARFRVKHAVRSSTIEEDILFYQAFPRVDFTATIDWRERGNAAVGVPQLKVAFGTMQRAARARCEGPFFITERNADGQEQPTQQWADLTGDDCGFTLYNDSRYGCDALGGRLRLTLLRNAYGPDPETDNGVHVVRFAFAPHGPVQFAVDAVRVGMAFNRPLLPRLTHEPAGLTAPYLRIQGVDDIVCTSLRFAEHRDGRVVRFFNTRDDESYLRFTLGDGITAAEEVNFLERPTGNALDSTDGWVALDFAPYEVKSILVK